MNKIIPILISFFLVSCAASQLSKDSSNRELYRLYKKAQHEKVDYILKYNSDSSFVLCIEKADMMLNAPVSLFVLNLESKNAVLFSYKTYHAAEWLDTENIKLTNKLEKPLTGKDILPEENRGIYYLYNVKDQELKAAEKHKPKS